jgi:hypothetical protein
VLVSDEHELQVGGHAVLVRIELPLQRRKISDATNSDATNSDATNSDAANSDATNSDATNFDATNSNAANSDTANSDATNSDETNSDATIQVPLGVFYEPVSAAISGQNLHNWVNFKLCM